MFRKTSVSPSSGPRVKSIRPLRMINDYCGHHMTRQYASMTRPYVPVHSNRLKYGLRICEGCETNPHLQLHTSYQLPVRVLPPEDGQVMPETGRDRERQ
jgi:hypothetical protein